MRRASTPRFREERRAFPYLVPAILIMVAINLYPLIQGMTRAFYTYRLLLGEYTFTGLRNFRLMIGDALFQRAFTNSLVWVFSNVGLQFIISFSLALILNSPMLRWRRLSRALILVPWATPPVVVALMWRFIFAEQGPLNVLLGHLGMADPPLWLLSPTLALWACIITNVWMGIPFMTVMLLAGLQSVERELYEAAAIDGASFLQTTFKVTLPVVKNVVLTVLALVSIWTFNMFDIVFILTRGGPGHASMTLPLYAFQSAFLFHRLGYAAAVGIVILSCLLIMIIFYIREVLK